MIKVVREPFVREANQNEGALIANLSKQGLCWGIQVKSLVDIRVFNTDALNKLCGECSEEC